MEYFHVRIPLMLIQTLITEEEFEHYDHYLQGHPSGNFWQSVERKKYYESLGKEVRMYLCDDCSASALVVIDRTLFGFSVWDIPRGPLWTNEASAMHLLEHIIEDAKREKCMELYWSPFGNWQLAIGNCQSSHRSIYPTATRILDLTLTEEELLKQMHPKGRYNIKVAEKSGVVIRKGSVEDVLIFYTLLKDTAKRDGFGILPEAHYERFLQCHTGSFALIAEHDKKPISGLIGVSWNGDGIYYYGASDHASRALMAPYALQWEAMRHCKALGCTSYDLLGISPPSAGYGDAWAGISDFKRKFGGEVVLYPAEQTMVLKPLISWLVRMKRKLVG
jgi:lipid II:glycine glycyltransferase (peptidoglycan interpeptide bridge formation enzyme)